MQTRGGERVACEGRYGAGAESLSLEGCHRAVDARDPRFDGLFLVGVESTGVFCRPSCPSRRSDRGHRLFFPSAADARAAGFRACLRCRPEVPGSAPASEATELAGAAVDRIVDGALDGRRLGDLAADLQVSERHLRRCVKRVVGTSPTELAITHRLLVARELLMESEFSVSRVAYASGFQSLRRFNAAFRERWETTPGQVRSAAAVPSPLLPPLVLRLPYRGPLAWGALRQRLLQGAMPGTACPVGDRYAATVCLEGHSGYVVAGDDPPKSRIEVWVSAGLVRVVVSLAGALRRLFDLDADLSAIDRDLRLGGLGTIVPLYPGVRLAGALDSFGAAMAGVVSGRDRAGSSARRSLLAIARTFGAPLETGVPGLDLLSPAPDRIADAGVQALEHLGVPGPTAWVIHRTARLLAEGRSFLSPDGDPEEAARSLSTVIPDAGVVVGVVARVLGWPDAFAPSDWRLQRSAGIQDACHLDRLAERWRPWRAYAAERLRLARD